MAINEILLLCRFANNIHLKSFIKKVLVLSHQVNVKMKNNKLALPNTQ